MLINEYKENFATTGNLNCAEKVLGLSNKVLDLKLDDNALKVASGFGAGMGSSHLCGAVAAAVMVLSLRYVKTIARESDIYKRENVLLKNIEEKLGSIMCKDLKEMFYNPQVKCEPVILGVIEVLQENL